MPARSSTSLPAMRKNAHGSSTTSPPRPACSHASRRRSPPRASPRNPAGARHQACRIFVLGMPRSGTTLVEQILASHRDVHGAGELNILDGILAGAGGPDGSRLAFPDSSRPPNGAMLESIGNRYVAALRKLRPTPGASPTRCRRISSSPGSYHLALPARASFTPSATGRHLRLLLLQAVQRGAESYYDLGELGRYQPPLPGPDGALAPRVAAGPHPRRALRGCGRRPRGPGAAHPRPLRPLDWDPRCLDFHRTERPVRTASAAQVRKPILPGGRRPLARPRALSRPAARRAEPNGILIPKSQAAGLRLTIFRPKFLRQSAGVRPLAAKNPAVPG